MDASALRKALANWMRARKVSPKTSPVKQSRMVKRLATDGVPMPVRALPEYHALGRQRLLWSISCF